ncbi:MAG: lamin tail domain-containing protein, partial [Planctomycetes bacterium]|nr:lamin tail domain-containing protein [Planctomycetota bacterium]
GDPALSPPAKKLLIAEIVVTPTPGEFIEIFNPGLTEVDLGAGYYLTDATNKGKFYYNVVTGKDMGDGNSNAYDFHIKFPVGTKIKAGERFVIACDSASKFKAEYGKLPNLSLKDDASKLSAWKGAIGATAGLTNGAEIVILYFWDGKTDLVTDVDYVNWGDKGEAVDKTGIAIDGPDPGTDKSTYKADTKITSQIIVDKHGYGFALGRIDYAEGKQVMTGGNGVGGRNETSENVNNTFSNIVTPSPGVASGLTFIPDGNDFGSVTVGDTDVVRVWYKNFTKDTLSLV